MVLRTGKKRKFPETVTSPDPEDKGVAWNGNELALWIADTRLRTLSSIGEVLK